MTEHIFVSSVAAEGPVARYGVPGAFIGAERDSKDPRRLVFNEAAVFKVANILPYQKAIRNGSLKSRSEAEFEAYLNKNAEDEKKAHVEATKAKAEALAKVAEDLRPPKVDEKSKVHKKSEPETKA